jgi:hypothetical protein
MNMQRMCWSGSPEVAQAVLDGRSTFIAQPATDMWDVGVIMYQLGTGAQRLERIVRWDVSLLCGA